MKKYDEKKLKNYELDILNYFSDFCDNNNLKYFLAYGTLLGAIRHNGFIPWDDDIDVYMPGEDYYLLKKMIAKINNDKYFYQSLETEKYYNLSFAKIRMNGTKAIEKKAEYEKIQNKGIYIDIFPLIPYPKTEKEKNTFWKKIKIFNLLVEADLKNKEKYNKYGKAGKILSKLFKIIPRKIRNFFAEKILKRIVLFDKKTDDYICIIDNKVFKKNFFNKTAIVSFEDKKYKAPFEYDKYLTSICGDYMKLPKIEERKSHSFIEVDFGENNN